MAIYENIHYDLVLKMTENLSEEVSTSVTWEKAESTSTVELPPEISTEDDLEITGISYNIASQIKKMSLIVSEVGEFEATVTTVQFDSSLVTTFQIKVYDSAQVAQVLDPDEPVEPHVPKLSYRITGVTVPYGGYGTLTVPMEVEEEIEHAKEYVEGNSTIKPTTFTAFDVDFSFKTKKSSTTWFQMKGDNIKSVDASGGAANLNTLIEGELDIDEHNSGWWAIQAGAQNDKTGKDIELHVRVTASDGKVRNIIELGGDVANTKAKAGVAGCRTVRLIDGCKVAVYVRQYGSSSITHEGYFSGHKLGG